MLTAKQRDSNLQIFDDLTPPFTQRSISLMGKPSIASSFTRKSSETDNSLPIPMHIRAASTPAHMEAQRNEQSIHPSHHKRYPSCVESSPRQDVKKFPTETYTSGRSGPSTDDHHSKRASSECTETITKRNASSPAAISLLVSAANNNNNNNQSSQQQRCLHSDDRHNRMPAKQNTLPIKASPELLAELLRGSSEKMTTAERERNKKLHAESYALPVAVQPFSVSLFFLLLF